MTITYYCRESKKNRRGTSPIELALTVNSKRVFINLERREYPDQFKKLMTSKKSNDLKTYLSIMDNTVNKAINDIARSGHILSADNLKEYIKFGSEQDRVYSFEQLFRDYMKVYQINSTYENIEKYNLVYREAIKSINPTDDVKTITNAKIKVIINGLYSTYTESTAVGKINKLKAIIRYGVDNHKIDCNPFIGIKVHRSKPVAEYLTPEEVEVIKNKDLNDRLGKVRDLFIFQCGSGLAYSDMASLTPTDVNIVDDRHVIQKTRNKTSIEYTSVLLPCAIEVWNKYNGVLPIISNQKYNSFLREIEIICNINKRLHTHLGRKTFATSLLNAGVPMEIVSKCLGHASVKISESTYAFFQKRTIISTVSEKIDNGLLS